MLWIALYLPELALQLALRGTTDDTPLVVISGPDNRPVVHAASRNARIAGIRPGIPLAAAQAPAGRLRIAREDLDVEAGALAALAGWACQFTPCVVLRSRQGLLLEVAGSLRLLGGVRAIGAHIVREVAALGYRATTGFAPNPLAAWLLAKACAQGMRIRGCTDVSELRLRLAPLPLALLDWPAETLALLDQLAITTIGAFLALPRGGVTQRFGEVVVESLDRALGLVPDPQAYFSLPEHYSGEVEFTGEVQEVEALLFPLHRLLLELQGFLRASGAGVEHLSVHLRHQHKHETIVRLALAAPERDAECLHALLRERLARTELPAAVTAISVVADECVPLIRSTLSWLPERQTQIMHLLHLHERLSARLGSDRVLTIESADDHRPEHAWQTETRRKSASLPFPLRPVWLLRQPRPLSLFAGEPALRGPLRRLSSPERIEAGWWDGDTIGRDYFVALNPCGEAFWIYRELAQSERWFVHGVFA